MTMYRRILAVVGMVLLVVGVGGFIMLKASAVGPTTDLDRAQVTGYATSSVLGRTSGPVSVELDGASAARIDAIIEGLPRANLRYLCAENQQEYRISFSAFSSRRRGAGVRTGFALIGYWCNNLVVEVPWHGPAVDRIDRDCALLAEVRELLPASAIATHRGTCADADGRLFLAVSRDKAPLHSAPLHQAPPHKTPLHKAPLHKAPLHKAPLHKTPLRKNAPRKGPAFKVPAPKAPASKAPASKAPAHRPAEHRPAPHGPAAHGPATHTPAAHKHATHKAHAPKTRKARHHPVRVTSRTV